MIRAKSIIGIVKGGGRVLLTAFYLYVFVAAFPFQYHLLHRSGELVIIDQLSLQYQGHDYTNAFVGYLTIIIWGYAFFAGWRLYLTALSIYKRIAARKDQGGRNGN
ncbi:hypothetical protein [uncultured Pseudodesulfovibrio sp.]|uniref:hypothetical protein n=1 Tax=uncultured Pseudodesulfovibrio sp. TaxID=2035858 RepID=UPI0029C7239F|nr:hypothetical protein [uncultured Pseudodesulfovibrio sp.]